LYFCYPVHDARVQLRHWRQHICARCNYKRGSATPRVYAYVFAHPRLYRDFVYSSYRMCHRWWNLNCKIHIKLSYDGPSAPNSFIESRLMHVYISRLTHICVKVSNRKCRIDRVHRRRHIAKDRTLWQRMSIILISLRNIIYFCNFWHGLPILLSYIFMILPRNRVISIATPLFLFILPF